MKMELKNAYTHGKYYEYFDDGTPCRELDFEEGNLSGIRKTWYRNGKVRSIENYKHDDLEGITTLFFESGNKQAELSFKNGLYHGPVKYFDSNGKLIAHYEFYNDFMIKIIL
jgi:antitoxin component YwqK of YwqJK toxin-antitoxin module